MPNSRSSLRILHVVDSLEIGGLERVMTNLAIAQKAHGHRVTVFSINSTGGFLCTLEAAGISVIVGHKKGTLDWNVLRLLRRAAREVDVVHSHNFVPNYYCALATIGMGPAPVLATTCHDMGARLRNRRLRWLYRWSLLKTAGVAMVGQQVCDHFVESGYVTRARATTVLNGLPVAQFEPTETLRNAARQQLGIAMESPVIGCVGRLVALKNHQLLIAQLPALLARHPGLKVVLAGDGPLADPLRAQAAQLGVTEHIVFLGAISAVEAWLPAFDIFAQPSQTEGLSIALLEACAAGLAIVATRVGGNTEIIRGGVTGLLVEVNDGAGLAEALDQLLSQPMLRRQLGAAASDWVRKNASMEALRLAYDTFYDAALLRK